MRARLAWILLAVSVAFNAFFAAGYLRARGRMGKARTMRGRAEIMAKRLDFDEAQQQALGGLLDVAEALRERRAVERDAFFDELIKDAPDEKALEGYVTGESANQHRLARLALMRKFVGMLRPEQRQRFVELVRKRSSPSK